MGGDRNINRPLIYRGVAEICAVAGINKKKLPYYVKNYGLPATKPCGKEWLAPATDLEKWAVDFLRGLIQGGRG